MHQVKIPDFKNRYFYLFLFLQVVVLLCRRVSKKKGLLPEKQNKIGVVNNTHLTALLLVTTKTFKASLRRDAFLFLLHCP